MTPADDLSNFVEPRDTPCGVEGKPPCPGATLLSIRTELILLLAGDRPAPDQLRRVADHVDRQLISKLRAAMDDLHLFTSNR